MKDSDVLVLDEPQLSLADQFYLPQVLKGHQVPQVRQVLLVQLVRLGRPV